MQFSKINVIGSRKAIAEADVTKVKRQVGRSRTLGGASRGLNLLRAVYREVIAEIN
ncbi:hypothetical protein M378DRAFT_169835 [Amanita muscaria Koide BX008]|uniref:Uncharacterized protein n=1 Tax=Amanita muscaria (strain Koide BX008) TaxID=946122 RepID=A0A0C2S8I3_AMAMK|nr:hypothetical protein M378DRAFT_169835 [Amanita muscaria Koide BX008]